MGSQNRCQKVKPPPPFSTLWLLQLSKFLRTSCSGVSVSGTVCCASAAYSCTWVAWGMLNLFTGSSSHCHHLDLVARLPVCCPSVLKGSSDACHQGPAFCAQVCSFCSLSPTALCSRVSLKVQVWRLCGRGLQIAIENIHSEMYSLLLGTYVWGGTRSNSGWGLVLACIRVEEDDRIRRKRRSFGSSPVAWGVEIIK